jgi:hypothetical protein
MSGGTDWWIRWTTTGCAALTAGTVSHLHMHLLMEFHGQPGWVAALTPLSVHGMIVAASTTLLADSRAEERGGVLHGFCWSPAAWAAGCQRAGCATDYGGTG